jgi:hypothetical protein
VVLPGVAVGLAACLLTPILLGGFETQLLARVGIYPPLNTVASFWTPIFIVIAILGLEIFFFGHVESRAAKVAFGVPGGRS